MRRALVLSAVLGVWLAATVAPALAIPGGRYAIGDSVMLGAKDELQRRGFVVNAVQSRQFHDAVSIVRQKAADSTLVARW